jgi:hypothetical protein
MKFIEDMMGIDVEAYDSIKCTVHNGTALFSPTHVETSLIYTLYRDRLKTKVIVEFLDYKFETISVDSYYLHGPYNASYRSPILKPKSSNDTISLIRNFLSMYRDSVNATHVGRFITLLDKVNTLSDFQEVANDEFVMNLTSDSKGVFIKVKPKTTLPCIWLSFWLRISENGWVTSIHDTLSLFKVMNVNIAITEEEAIQIALNNASESINSLGAKIARAETSLCLYPGRGGDEYVLYPYWFVDFFFDKIYLFNDVTPIDGYSVGIWADTGEIHYGCLQGGKSPPQEAEALNLWLVPPLLLIASALIIITYKKPKDSSIVLRIFAYF